MNITLNKIENYSFSHRQTIHSYLLNIMYKLDHININNNIFFFFLIIGIYIIFMLVNFEINYLLV